RDRRLRCGGRRGAAGGRWRCQGRDPLPAKRFLGRNCAPTAGRGRRLDPPRAGSGRMRLGVAAAVVDGVLLRGDVEVADGQITAVGVNGGGGRGIAIPGLVDLQVNGFGGVDFASSDAAGYRRAGEVLLEHGVTSFQPTMITAPE